MSRGFESVHFNMHEQADELANEVAQPGMMRAGPRDATAPAASPPATREEAARFFLNQVLKRDARPTVRSMTSERAVGAADMLHEDTTNLPDRASLVRFVQTKAAIPIFGSRMAVQIDRNRKLISIDGQVADIGNVPAEATVSVKDAIRSIAKLAGLDADTMPTPEPPELVFFHEESADRWHLVYHFHEVRAAPADFMSRTRSHGIGRSPAQRHPELDYIVDAHDAVVLLYWSSTPTMAGVFPVECLGTDEYAIERVFYGRQADARFVMSDPLRDIQTFDFALKDIDTSEAPSSPISEASTKFVHAAAVSAHFHAMRVDSFLREVFVRDGIDNKRMPILSYVNCVCQADEDPPQWQNAAWWKNRMWYGQVKDKEGKLKSFSRYLDIIAHELMHGVTAHTAGLVYLNQSGALNESFSDIFGVIISNWDVTKPETGGDVATWKWEIGAGLGKDGLPLRDFSKPSRTRDPDHMDKYVVTRDDNGGVHTNSNIHNLAAYGVLTAVNEAGEPQFTPKQVALLYYLCLTRLSKLSDFAACRSTLRNVAGAYFAGDPRLKEKLHAIEAAYSAVGIEAAAG